MIKINDYVFTSTERPHGLYGKVIDIKKIYIFYNESYETIIKIETEQDGAYWINSRYIEKIDDNEV